MKSSMKKKTHSIMVQKWGNTVYRFFLLKFLQFCGSVCSGLCTACGSNAECLAYIIEKKILKTI